MSEGPKLNKQAETAMLCTQWRSEVRCLASLLCVALAWCQSIDAAQLHVVLAADSRSNLPGFETTVINITSLLEGAGKKGISVQVHSVSQREVSPTTILSAIRALNGRINATDSFLFYYVGHGGTLPGIGHVLQTSGGDLLRSEVRFAAEALGGRGVCLLTDCCSVEIKGPNQAFAPVLSDTAARLFDRLFLQSNGTVDVTAATFDPTISGSGKAFYTGREGGLFTQSVYLTILEADRYYKQFGENLFLWDTYFSILKARVDETYKRVRQREMSLGGAPEELRNTLKQEPMAFQLGGWASQDGPIVASQPRPGKAPRLGAVVHTSYRYGVVVSRTVPNGAAERILVDRIVEGRLTKSSEKMLPGDIIVSANGAAINTIDDLFNAIDRVPPGGELQLEGHDKSKGYKERYRGVIILP